MKSHPAAFPEFVRALPEAELPFDGLHGWLLRGEQGLLFFNESDVEMEVPEHSHGNQWGAVLAGAIDLTVSGETRRYERGDTYFIPAGAVHRARIHPGFRAVDVFEDRDRYTARKPRGSLID